MVGGNYEMRLYFYVEASGRGLAFFGLTLDSCGAQLIVFSVRGFRSHNCLCVLCNNMNTLQL